MWSQVERDLERLLTLKIYKVLMPDAPYRGFLSLTGLGPNFPADLKVPATLNESFRNAARIHAHITIEELKKSAGLIESTAGAKLITGRAASSERTFYRFWDSRAAKKRIAPWWFSGNVMTYCKRDAGKSVERRRQWLREHLAVSIDWSAMDKLDVIVLEEDDEVPAITAKGDQAKMYSAGAIPRGRATSREYWPNFGKYFPGGVDQTVFPFVPTAKGRDMNAELSRG